MMSFTPAKRTGLLAVLLIVLLAIAFFIWSAMTRADYQTDDAWVAADYTLVAPKVSGYISQVLVRDNQQVKAGDLLATLDDRDYRVALESAEASLQLSQAKLASIAAQREQQQAVIAQNKAAVTASQATLSYAVKMPIAIAACSRAAPQPPTSSRKPTPPCDPLRRRWRKTRLRCWRRKKSWAFCWPARSRRKRR